MWRIGISIKHVVQALVLASEPTGDETVDKENKCIKDSLAGIIFLGTPHGGSGFSILARIYCVFHYWDGASTTLIRYLDPNSEKARKLEDSFALYSKSVRTINYYESIPDSFLGYYTQPVVTKAASTRLGGRSMPLDANHYGLNKFEGENDSNYTEVRSTILEMVEYKLGQEILNWLLCSEPKPSSPDTFYKGHLETLQTSICDDLIHPDAHSSWHNGKDKWLWCHGMPGAGKSCLATGIIKKILEQVKNDTERTGIAYIYCVYSDKTQSARNFVRILLHQICTLTKEIPKNLESLYQDSTNKDTPTSPSLDELEGVLITEIRKFHKFYLIVDALDECQKNDRNPLELNSDTKSRFLRTLHFLRNDIRLLITSRDAPGSTLGPLSPIPFREIEISPSHETLQVYIGTRINSEPDLVGMDTAKKDEITATIAEKAARMFLPAHLYVNFLAGKAASYDDDTVMDSARTLPSFSDTTLEFDKKYREAYSAILKDIWSNDRPETLHAKKAFSWIVFSRDPLNLTINMVQRALSLEEGIDKKGSDEDRRRFESSILPACRGLAHIDQETGRFRFVHSTAAEYFSHPQVRKTDYATGDEDIARACLSCILSRNEDAMGQKSLFQYASLHWGHHAEGREEAVTGIQELFDNEDRLQASLQIMEKYLFPGRSSVGGLKALHLAAYFGLVTTTERLLKGMGESEVDAKDAYGWTALRWAIVGASNSTSSPSPQISLLIEKGASLLSEDANELQTIFWAAGERRLTFNHDFPNTDVPQGNGSTIGFTKYIATVEGSKQGFLIVLQHFRISRTSLGNFEFLVKQLPQNDLDIRRHSDTRTLLSVVAENWQWGAVRSLIERGADKDAQDDVGMTPLLWALKPLRRVHQVENIQAFSDRELRLYQLTEVHGPMNIEPHIIKLIGNDIEQKDENGRTALSLAVENRFHKVVQSLLENGADPNEADNQGMTALHWACTLPRFRILIVRNPSWEHRTTMAVAIEDIHQLPAQSFSPNPEPTERTVELLLRFGANQDAQNYHGLTPLELARMDGFESHERLLGIYGSVYRNRTSGLLPLVSIDWAPPDMQRRDLQRIIMAMFGSSSPNPIYSKPCDIVFK
ncbi:hypothetical protein F4806DRAFT_503784 [Annulohypoxylon nitens]|nr:hypothetical protein F4806DRAFT_503784 [Annulohypoxylon nitens]